MLSAIEMLYVLCDIIVLRHLVTGDVFAIVEQREGENWFHPLGAV